MFRILLVSSARTFTVAIEGVHNNAPVVTAQAHVSGSRATSVRAAGTSHQPHSTGQLSPCTAGVDAHTTPEQDDLNTAHRYVTFQPCLARAFPSLSAHSVDRLRDLYAIT